MDSFSKACLLSPYAVKVLDYLVRTVEDRQAFRISRIRMEEQIPLSQNLIDMAIDKIKEAQIIEKRVDNYKYTVWSFTCDPLEVLSYTRSKEIKQQLIAFLATQDIKKTTLSTRAGVAPKSTRLFLEGRAKMFPKGLAKIKKFMDNYVEPKRR